MATPSAPDPARLPPAICIAGPTASGKSAVALHLAEHLPIEIISVDSALVYRGMDIGTAKPTPAERAAVPHHLIDILDPRESYSAAEFARDAQRLAHDIRARGRLPVLVGGTMLYFKALLHGLDALPPADPTVRRLLDEQAVRIGWAAMHAELARVDPTTAARLPPGDSQRIQRALEVWHITGQPLSSLHTTKKVADNDDATSAWPLFSLEPTDRAWLHQRIAERFELMLHSGGLLDEVRHLRARGDLSLDLPSMRCVGYRQAWEALDAAMPENELTTPQLGGLRERGIAATRQLAKRQFTWLRSMGSRQILPVHDTNSPNALALKLLDSLKTDVF